MTLVRRASAADLSEITRIAVAAYQPYVALIGRAPAPMVADFAGLIAKGHVYVTGTPIKGFVVWYAQDTAMHLENVAIDPVAAGQGLGTALIGACEQAARKAGLAHVTLYTNEKMAGPLRLYPRLGYTEIARHEEAGFRRVYFEKTLAPLVPDTGDPAA